MTASSQRIKVRCDCGAALTAPAAAAGRSMPCPRCGVMLAVPDPLAEEPLDSDYPAPGEGAIDFRMGRGIAYSLMAGAAMSLAWAILTATTGISLGLIAVAIGFGCGIAMMMGTQRRSPEVGLAAAGITLLSIIASKVLTVILATALAGPAEAPSPASTPEDDQAAALLDEIAAPAELDDAEADDDATDALAASPDDGEADAQPLASTPPADDEGGVSVIGLLSLLVVMGMWDLILLAMALSAAYFSATFNDVT